MSFEWDDEKDEANFRKHGVRFTEASTIFKDPHGIELLDLYNSEEEERWIRLGISKKMKLLIVVYCDRQTTNAIRIISARLATRTETQIYKKRTFMRKEYDFSKAKKAKVFKEVKVIKTIRLDAEILMWLEDEAEKEGVGYQTFLNSFLKKAMNQEKSVEERLRKLEQAVFPTKK